MATKGQSNTFEKFLECSLPKGRLMNCLTNPPETQTSSSINNPVAVNFTLRSIHPKAFVILVSENFHMDGQVVISSEGMAVVYQCPGQSWPYLAIVSISIIFAFREH
jgi:hypothetical protein